MGVRTAGQLFMIAAVVSRTLADDDKLFKGQSAVSLTKTNFHSALKNVQHFVNFYTSWCGHCKRLAPTWEQLAEKFAEHAEKVIIAKVNCMEETELCAKQGITGYPTLKFYKVGEEVSTDIYKGARSLDELSAWVLERIEAQKSGETVSPGHFPYHPSADAEAGYLKKFVNFYVPDCTTCEEFAPTWKNLTREYANSNEIRLFGFDCSIMFSLCHEFDVIVYPTLLFINKTAADVKKYRGPRTFEDIASFIDKMIADEPWTEPDENVAPLLLTEKNFNEAVATGVTFVKFFAPWCGHCRNLAPTWTDLTRLIRRAKIAKVDCTQQESLCTEYKVRGYPSLILFKDGKPMEEYVGSRELDDLKNYVNSFTKITKDEL